MVVPAIGKWTVLAFKVIKTISFTVSVQATPFLYGITVAASEIETFLPAVDPSEGGRTRGAAWLYISAAAASAPPPGIGVRSTEKQYLKHNYQEQK